MKVFINCPFDPTYLKLLRYLLFTLLYMDNDPQISLSDSDCGKKRLEKIEELMKTSDVSIHDISKIKSKSGKEFYRLNMPFELGIDYGIERIEKKGKKYLVLEGEKYSSQKGLSDFSAFDVFSHNNDPNELVKIVRDWFVNNRITSMSTPAAHKITLDYFDCWAYIYEELIKKGYPTSETDNIPINEFIDLVKEWKSKKVA